MSLRVFVSGTGTGVGKTFVTCAIVEALRARGERVTALKPLETGCDPDPVDALALAAAAGQPELASLDGLYRAAPALAPYAATLAGAAPLDWDRLLSTLEPFRDDPNLLVEGAGGLLVPLDRERTISDLAAALELPLLLVASNALGVLSDTLAVAEHAARRGLPVAAVILVEPASSDRSITSNIDILGERLGAPVIAFPRVETQTARREAGRLILDRLGA